MQEVAFAEAVKYSSVVQASKCIYLRGSECRIAGEQQQAVSEQSVWVAACKKNLGSSSRQYLSRVYGSLQEKTFL